MEKEQTGVFKKAMAVVCHNCPLCKYGRNKPKSLIGKLMHHPLHADNCPFWKAEKEAYQDS